MTKGRKKRDGLFLIKLRQALYKSWSSDTSYDPKNWKKNNPAWGQCAVTALVVKDYLGGDIVSGSLGNVPDKNVRSMRFHFWNRLPDGREIDFTESQFKPDQRKFIGKGKLRRRKHLLSIVSTTRRYNILKARVQKFLRE
jgi:hypothetical protein